MGTNFLCLLFLLVLSANFNCLLYLLILSAKITGKSLFLLDIALNQRSDIRAYTRTNPKVGLRPASKAETKPKPKD